MAEAIVLDALLLSVVLLLIPIGVWRGAGRELIVLAGLVLGGVVADAWADRWGRWLAEQFSVSGNLAPFATAMIVLATCTLGIGYGGSVFAGGGRHDAFDRVVGGAIAGLNGLVFFGLAIGFVNRNLLRGRSDTIIEDTWVADALGESFSWLVFGVAGTLFAVVSLRRIVGQRDDGWLAIEPGTTDSGMVLGRRAIGHMRWLHVGRAGDSGKVEPALPVTERVASGQRHDRTSAALPGQTVPLTVHWSDCIGPREDVGLDDVSFGTMGRREIPGSGPFTRGHEVMSRDSDRAPTAPDERGPGREVVDQWLRRGASASPSPSDQSLGSSDPSDGVRRLPQYRRKPSPIFPWLIELTDDPPDSIDDDGPNAPGQDLQRD